MSTTVTFDIDAIMAKVTAVANRGLLAAAEVGASTCRKNLSTGTRWVSSAPGAFPSFQTGELAGGIVAEGPETLGPLRARFGTYVKHGRYMEHGATIRPKNVKAIPVPCNIQARQMLGRIKGASLRTQNLIPFKKDGKSYLGEKTPKGKIKKNGALFVLRKSVTIAARPWLAPSAAESKQAMQDRYSEVLKQELRF